MVQLGRDALASLFYFYISVMLLKDRANENMFLWQLDEFVCAVVSVCLAALQQVLTL